LALKYKITSITEYRTDIHLGIDQPEHVSQVKVFDSNGFKTKETEYNLAGEIDAILSYSYDSAGNLILVSAVSRDGGLLFRETRSFDANRNRTGLYYYLPDGTYKYRNVATYDKAGRVTELRWYWPAEGLVSTNKYQYAGDKKIEDAEYNQQNELNYRWKYEYDVRGNLTEAAQNSPANIINRKLTYEYNNDNQLVKQTTYYDTALHSDERYEYDQDLLKSKTLYNLNGKVTAKFRYEYERAK